MANQYTPPAADPSDPGPHIRAFCEECSKMDVSFQEKLDDLLQFKLQSYPSQLFQCDVLLFLRVCFFLAEVPDNTLRGLEAWMNIPRNGFTSQLNLSDGVMDVSVFQIGDYFSISTLVRLRSLGQVLSPPAWLSPPTPETIPHPATVAPKDTLRSQATQSWDYDSFIGIGPEPFDDKGPLEGRAPTPFNPILRDMSRILRTATRDIIDGPSQSHGRPPSRTPSLRSFKGGSFMRNGGLGRDPTIPNILPPNPSERPSGLERSSSIIFPASFERSGGLQRSDTVSTIRLPGAAGISQNREASNVSNSQASHVATPPAQDAAASNMDVDAKSMANV